MGRRLSNVQRAIALAVAATVPILPAGAAAAQVLGSDAAACSARQGPAIQATITGLKDRQGTIKLELYPANEEDFLKHDNKLRAEGKLFRRVQVETPASGNPVLCIRVPAPGRYALFFGHDRDGKRKFNFWSDGAGFPGNQRIGRARPKLANAIIDVGGGVTTTNIRAQYLRGLLGGFGFGD